MFSKLQKSLNHAIKFQKLIKLAEAGDFEVQNRVGQMYSLGTYVSCDYEKAFFWFSLSAKQGYATAQTNLGESYEYGHGVYQDDAKAVYWYNKAAEQGDPIAQNALGWMYEHGRGVRQDFLQAVIWYRKSSQQGEPDAQYNLGLMYNVGRGISQDYKQAMYWFQRAAERQHAPAQTAIGLLYYNGLEVVCDLNEALIWFQKAAQQNYLPAYTAMGDVYDTLNDTKQALECYLKAAEGGEAAALMNLGLMFTFGQGINRNTVVVFALLELAVLGGQTSAMEVRDTVSKELSCEEKKKAIEWVNNTHVLWKAINKDFLKSLYSIP